MSKTSSNTDDSKNTTSNLDNNTNNDHTNDFNPDNSGSTNNNGNIPSNLNSLNGQVNNDNSYINSNEFHTENSKNSQNNDKDDSNNYQQNVPNNNNNFNENYPNGHNEPNSSQIYGNLNNNSDKNLTLNDAKSDKNELNTDVKEAATKKLTQKNYKPVVRPDSNISEQKEIQEDLPISKLKKLFEIKHKNLEYKTICFDITNYLKSGTENGFIKFDRSARRDFNFAKSGYFKVMRHSSGPSIKATKSDTLFSKSLSFENYKKTVDIEMKKKLNKLNQIYLAHLYNKIPTSFNYEHFVDQIDCYMMKDCIALAHLHGFSFFDYEGNFVPTVLTDRPVNGPLSSLFVTIKSNKEKEDEISHSDSFNMDSFCEISAEQKYAMICGITRAIDFIHKNHFVHSNLNPTTVYMNENLFPVLCDYIFIPPFEVITLSENENENKNSDDEYNENESRVSNYYKYKFDKKPSPDTFQNIIYVAPEIKNGEEFNSSADIYSLGMTIFYIIAEKEATFDDEGKLIYPDEINIEWRNLIDRCISLNPSNRPKASQILNDELFNMDKMPVLIKSINPNINAISIPDIMNSYLILLKNTDKPVFNIFQKMIPNIADIDYETRLIIMAAEKGDTNSLARVGDFFCFGKNNLHKDECWAYECYKEASKLGSERGSIYAAQFNERGVGMDINLTKAIAFYEIALKQSQENNLNHKKIISKINELEELNSTRILVNIPMNKTVEEIKGIFKDFNVEVIPIPTEKGEKLKKMKIKFKNNEELMIATQEINDYPKNYQIDHKNIKLILPYKKVKIESHRYKSLSTSLEHIELKDYQFKIEENQMVILGSGHFADTFLVVKKGTEEMFVAKIFKKQLKATHINLLKREILMSSNLNHPCILKYIGYNEFSMKQYYQKVRLNPNLPTLLMEYIPNNTLEKAIKNRIKGICEFDDTARLKSIIGIASALNEMYVNNIIHRDLKPENILMNKNYEPVICDLGLSRQFTNLTPNKMSDKIGSPAFMAPELFNLSNGPIYYKSEVDVYSFGIIMFQILTLTKTKKIYKDSASSQMKLIKSKLNNDYVDNLLKKYEMNQVFKNLIQLCWNVEKDERPDPFTIYETLVDTVNESLEPLLPNANMDAVKEYIDSLPKI